MRARAGFRCRRSSVKEIPEIIHEISSPNYANERKTIASPRNR